MNKHPKKWKMAVLVWIAIYPTITLLFVLFGDLLDRIPTLHLKTLLTTVIVVPLSVYWIIPALQRFLYKWLHR